MIDSHSKSCGMYSKVFIDSNSQVGHTNHENNHVIKDVERSHADKKVKPL